ncbi:MAG TPA: alcohol dehydrogenase catalytic domain-containing protein [Jatrophihabitans sp.]|jgi:alcohol dehydrogenase
MRAVVYDRFGAPPVVTDIDEPRCPPHSAVIKVEATGVCRSDWHGWRGHDPDITLPHVPGARIRRHCR